MQCETAVRPAVAGDVGELSALLAEAFVSNPVASWLIGDVAARYTTFLRVFEVELMQALSHGIVRVAGDGAGVAVWQPYPMVLETVTGHDRALLGAVGIYRRRFAHLRAARDEHRSAALRLPAGPDRPERPDQRAEAAVAAGGAGESGEVVGHELVWWAAAPWLRRRRIGAALLADHQRRLDAAGLVGHTVTDEPYVRDLLARHGWRTPGPRHLSPAGPPLWSMRRQPGAVRRGYGR
ncbi:hypothetical protein [Solwaraspora sp. WMMA2101]|uniref:hypothetical protein n=1 Tax=Solwaraspora sp. WMMA2101 TaxID=3404124 RepID=UPI003B93BB14